MRHQPDISLSRFLMLVSLVLLGILEYLWLHNEYKNKYRDMEDKLNHVMFSTIRDVEDSLIFSRLATMPSGLSDDSCGPSKLSIVIHADDSILTINKRGPGMRAGQDENRFKSRHPMKGLLLKELTLDTNLTDSPSVSISTMVMSHLRTVDSTGEFEGYEIISWQGGDTMIRQIMSRPQMDVVAGKKIALSNPNYKADLFHELLPHLSFALVLWLIVGAAFYYIWKNLQKQIQLNALRDEFVSNITHELKTPITTVGVALESLRLAENNHNAQNRRYLDICQSELKRLSMLVERILHSRSPQVHYEKMDVRQVLEEVMHHMKVQFDNRQAKVEVRQDGDDFVIQGDKSHMGGVMYNLLDNALKYSPEHPVIHVHLSRSNGSIRLDIADNGIGIDPDYHDKIFEKLYRVPYQNRHDVKGHGLGLSYVADVVHKHQGKIDLVSQPGKGSTFTMTLPAWQESTSSHSSDVDATHEISSGSYSHSRHTTNLDNGLHQISVSDVKE